jgi:hypothetical protein
MSTPTVTPATWYGDYVMELDRTGHWQVGPLNFWLTPSGQEWRFAWLEAEDTPAPALIRDFGPGSSEPEAAEANASRLGLRQTAGHLRLSPLTADRSVVVKTVTPFLLPPRQELTLYISSVAWLKVEVGDPAQTFLEIPLHRPSDTWFGSSTGDGEMCYALRTNARLHPENLLQPPHRVLSALRVRNLAPTNLKIDKVLLPMPHMSLFAGADGQLWTEEVTFEHTEGRHDSPLDLSAAPPELAGPCHRLGGPRVRPVKGLLTRAFGGLLGGGY